MNEPDMEVYRQAWREAAKGQDVATLSGIGMMAVNTALEKRYLPDFELDGIVRDLEQLSTWALALRDKIKEHKQS